MYYFDQAATSLKKPQAVADAMYDAIASGTIGNPSRGGHAASIHGSRIIFQTREKIAELLNASNYDVVLTKNATEALNLAIKGLFGSGDHIVTTVLEHNSVLRPLYELEAQGATLDFVTFDKETGVLNYEEFETLIHPKTKAIVVTAASNVTGVVTDLNFLSKLCRQHDLRLIVDGAQATGLVEMNLDELGVDVYCFTGHKSLYGPQGVGGMCVKKDVSIRPAYSGGSGTGTFSKTHPTSMPERLEAGTPNAHGLAGLLAGVEHVLAQGAAHLGQQAYALARYFYDHVQSLPGVNVYFEPQEKLSTGVVALNIANVDAAEFAVLLEDQYQILIRAGAHCAPLVHTFFGTKEQGMIRFSFSAMNTEEEVAYAIRVMKELMSHG
ncbi:MAG: aminotransferase class V-fold PLP-dependent enzyme [Turicibacter sp.]|nr:aminotransferase class V-fold PLP-dependent enzyme [Turicibacter sp.]